VATDEKSSSAVGDPSEVPLRRIVAPSLLFGAWTLGVAALHAIWPERLDLIFVVLAEIAISPVVIFLFQNIEFVRLQSG
jgi:hypothetical protein